MNIKYHLQKIIEKITNKTCNNCIYHSGCLCDREDEKGLKCRTGVFPVGFVRKRLLHEFVHVTKHYGFCFERCGGQNVYVIYSIKFGKPTNVVTAMKERKYAIKECSYLEKLNYRK